VPIFDKATGRVVAVLVLLIAIAAALRGYLPGIDRTESHRPPDSGASLVYVAALLSVSLVIVAVALIARLRDPRRAPSSATGLPDRFSDGRGRPRWRVLLVGAAVLVAWLLLLWLLSRLFIPQEQDQILGQPQSASQASVPKADNAPRPAPPDADTGRDALPFLIAGTVALLAMIVAAAVVNVRKRRVSALPVEPAHAPSGPTPTVVAPALVRAAESGMAEIEDPNREPRQAIIACYAAMEWELSRFPGAIPQDFDTPTEVLARAVEYHALHIDNAVELVNLFEEARFSPHVMDESHRASALRVLRLVLAELRSTV
jgi:hypothetical protein